jgi:hypothetical protein
MTSPTAQQQSRQSNAPAPASSQNLQPNKGMIEQGTYKNPSIGLEFTPAENLDLQEPEMRGAIVTVKALDRGWSAGLLSARSLTVFSAEAFSRYPEGWRDATSYMKMVIRAQEADGFQQIGSVTSDRMSGIQFVRADFTKGRVYEAVLVTAHNGYAFMFIFTGSGVGVTNVLIASTKVKFTP